MLVSPKLDPQAYLLTVRLMIYSNPESHPGLGLQQRFALIALVWALFLCLVRPFL